jgi:hypothetical protein
MMASIYRTTPGTELLQRAPCFALIDITIISKIALLEKTDILPVAFVSTKS